MLCWPRPRIAFKKIVLIETDLERIRLKKIRLKTIRLKTIKPKKIGREKPRLSIVARTLYGG